jgi:hypothetical protein
MRDPVNVGSDLKPVNAGSDLKPVNVGSDLKLVNVGSDLKLVNVGSDLKPVNAGSDLKPVNAGSDPSSSTKINITNKKEKRNAFFPKSIPPTLLLDFFFGALCPAFGLALPAVVPYWCVVAERMVSIQLQTALVVALAAVLRWLATTTLILIKSIKTSERRAVESHTNWLQAMPLHAGLKPYSRGIQQHTRL